MHGNEPAGVRALERVAARLAEGRGPLRGRLAALVGNLAALERAERFVDRDLNRGWLTVPQAGRVAEDLEQQELKAALDAVLDSSPHGVVVIDMHTTSSGGPAFSLIGDTLANRDFAVSLGLPIVLGLEELLDGTLLDYLHGRVDIAVGVEGGQHDDPASVDLLVDVLLRAMERLGMVPPSGEPDAEVPEPRFLEVRHRWAVDPSRDGFRMRPGYLNFQPVTAGEVVAMDARGPVRVPEGGLLLMPLYQRLGEDGFFIVRAIRPLWIRLSGALRGLGLDRWVHWLPGVRARHGPVPSYEVDRHVARWFALEIFHLLGYRRVREQEGVLVVTRR
jgi:succinylglutamate desuccinylase